MLKSTAAAACCLAIATTFSVSSLNAMPVPEAGDSELSAGLAQWGAETQAPEMSQAEMLKHLDELAPPAPEQPRKTAATKAAMCNTLASAAQEHQLPVGFFVRLINQESGFDPTIVSHAGAQGVAQFMPEVAKEWGLKNPFNPHEALVASARFLRSLYDQFGNWGLAAAAYNGGMGRVQKWLDKRGKLPDETRNYVKTITGVAPERWVGTKDRGTFTLPARAPCQEIAYLADAPIGKTYAALPVMQTQIAAGPPSKTTSAPVVSIRRGLQVAVIKVRGKVASKVAAVAGKIAAPKSIVADAGSRSAKGQRGKASAEKLAEKAPAKTQAKTRDTGKKTKGRVQLADARGARK